MPSSMPFPDLRTRPFAGLLGTIAVCAIMLAAAGSSDAPAATASAPAQAGDTTLRPTTRQRALAPRIAELLEQAHFSHVRIDDAFSAQVFDHFVESLDSQRSYFTAADIAGFANLRTRFDDMIHSGRIDPGFEIFALFQRRNRERMAYAIQLLDH